MSATKKVLINKCYGGFGLSEAAYERLIEWGVPVREYREQKQDENTGLYLPEPLNEGEVIFDRDLTSPSDKKLHDAMRHLGGRYWETWTSDVREHPLVVRVVEEMGEAADGPCARLAIVEVPAGVAYKISEYDGREHIAEVHRTWS